MTSSIACGNSVSPRKLIIDLTHSNDKKESAKLVKFTTLKEAKTLAENIAQRKSMCCPQCMGLEIK